MKTPKAQIRAALLASQSANRAALMLSVTPNALAKYMAATNDSELKRLYQECKQRGYAISGGRGHGNL